jgi:transposase
VQLWCGIDWAENHHDVSVVDEMGTQRVRLRIDDTVAGFSQLMSMLAEEQQFSAGPVTVAIETAKGLLPPGLRAAGVPLVAINPLAVSRYRDRHSPSRAKSDAGDALVLANILRTDPHSHRPLPADSELAQSIHVLARAHQDAVWDRMQIASKLRSVLRQYYPAFLAAFADLASKEARAALHLAPSPAQGQLMRKSALTAALRRAAEHAASRQRWRPSTPPCAASNSASHPAWKPRWPSTPPRCCMPWTPPSPASPTWRSR